MEAYLEATATGGHDKLENLIALQNPRLDTLEASMTKQAEMTKERMQGLEQAISNESRLRMVDKNTTARTLAAIESRLAGVEVKGGEGHAAEENNNDDPAAGAGHKSTCEGGWIQDSLVLGNWTPSAMPESKAAD